MNSNIKSGALINFNGVLLINKPRGITSYGIIKKLKKVFF